MIAIPTYYPTTFSLEQDDSKISSSSNNKLFIRDVDIENTCYEQVTENVRVYYFYDDIDNQRTLTTTMSVKIQNDKRIALSVVTFEDQETIVVFENVEIHTFENEQHINQRVNTEKGFITINSHNSSFKNSFERALTIASLNNTTIIYKDHHDMYDNDEYDYDDGCLTSYDDRE